MREGVDGGEEDRKNSLERATSFPLSPLFRADTALEMQTLELCGGGRSGLDLCHLDMAASFWQLR